MAAPEINIRKLRNVNLRGGIVIDGFPSVGLANAIASQCLIHSLKVDFVGVIDSAAFPSLSIINNAMPAFPARIYASEDLKLAMFVSELNLDPLMFRSVADLIITWSLESNCDLIVSAAGIPYEEGETIKDTSPVFAVGSTPSALKRAAAAGIPPVLNGSVSGIPAVLLNEGTWRNFDVIVLFVKVVRDVPDFRAGAAVAQALAKLAPGASCDIPYLMKEAESMEKTLKKIQGSQQQAAVSKEPFYG